MKLEKSVDRVRYSIDHELVNLRGKEKLPVEALSSLMIIISRFERVADQACNMCEEVLYMCIGEDIKHKGKDVFRVLFIDEHDACRGQMAVGIGNSLDIDRFIFSSAGIAHKAIDPRTKIFMFEKNIDISEQTSKYVNQVLNLENYPIIISLCKEADDAFPPPPVKTVRISWNVVNPSKVTGQEEEIQAAYEKTFQYLDSHIRDIVEATLGNEVN